MNTTSHHNNDDREQHRLIPDGGIERADTATNEDLPVGARVLDRDADDPNPNLAVVVEHHEEPAYAVHIDALDGQSVADVNEEYPASGRVATVAYADDLDAALDVWREASPDALADICEDRDVRTYTFPTARLRPADEFSTGSELSPGDRVRDARTGTRGTIVGWPADDHARVARDGDGAEALIPVERLRGGDSEGGGSR